MSNTGNEVESMYFSDILILGIIIGGFLFYNISKALQSVKIKRMLAKAKKAEREAIYLLKKNGFNVIGIQVKRNIMTYIDGKPYSGYVKVDFLAQKNRKKYVVEVKTGQQTRATQSLVRRQLLEYFLVYNPQGILLLDMERKKIQTIEFDWGTDKYSWTNLFIAGILGLFIGILIWSLFG